MKKIRKNLILIFMITVMMLNSMYAYASEPANVTNIETYSIVDESTGEVIEAVIQTTELKKRTNITRANSEYYSDWVQSITFNKKGSSKIIGVYSVFFTLAYSPQRGYSAIDITSDYTKADPGYGVAGSYKKLTSNSFKYYATITNSKGGEIEKFAKKAVGNSSGKVKITDL